MSSEKELCEVLTDVNSLVQTLSLNATGSIGEIVAQLILLLAHDAATKRSNQSSFSKAVTVKQFLSVLVGDDQYSKIMEDEISTEMKEGLVCFTHFIKKLDELTHKDMIPDFVARAAAAQLKDRTEGIDLVIPIILKNGDIGFLVIQVKNIAEPADLKGVAEKTLPKSSFFSPTKNYDEHFFLGLVMSLGESEKHEHETKTKKVKFDYYRKKASCNFILHGLNTTIYPFLIIEVVERLKTLLNCDRTNLDSMKQIYGKEVLERVAIGCANYTIDN
jgi:hypothetical protein